MDTPQSIYSLGDGNLDYFHLGAIMNKAAKHIDVPVLVVDIGFHFF